MTLESRELQRRFERRLNRIAAAGIELPADFIQLQTRLKAFFNTAGTPVKDRIITAIIDGDKNADLPLLRAVALAESIRDNQLRKDFADDIAAGVHTKLRALYNQHGRTNYATLAAKFDEHAQAFTAAAQQVDIEAPADVVVQMVGADLDAWRSALHHAQAMTNLLPALAAAATLCDIGDDNNKDEQLSLVVDTEGHDRQALWAAWDTDETERLARAREEAGDIFSRPTVPHTRTGRWGALIRLGARIRAVKLEDFESYPRRQHPEFAPNNVQSISRIPDDMLHRAAT